MASHALTFPPLTLSPDTLYVLRILHELLSAGEDPCYEDVAHEMDLSVAEIRVHIAVLVAGRWINVPADSRQPIQVLRPPEMPDFTEVELALGPVDQDAARGPAQ